jgi:hypothetical protein
VIVFWPLSTWPAVTRQFEPKGKYMKKIKKKFRDRWCNQGDLGAKFGMTAIEVGRILIAHGLKDEKTKEATKEALSNGYARFTPLKDGTPFFMWDKEKVTRLLLKENRNTPVCK